MLSGSEVFNVTYDEQTRYHRVLKGLHVFHVYATEYWADYLLSGAKHVSDLENNSLLFAIARQMADKLNATANLSTIGQIETDLGVQVEGLAYLQQYSVLYNQVRATLDARSIKRLEYELLYISGMYSRETTLSYWFTNTYRL